MALLEKSHTFYTFANAHTFYTFSNVQLGLESELLLALASELEWDLESAQPLALLVLALEWDLESEQPLALV
jgi:hypothetical protein